MTGLPHNSINCLGRSCCMRVPAPAATSTAESVECIGQKYVESLSKLYFFFNLKSKRWLGAFFLRFSERIVSTIFIDIAKQSTHLAHTMVSIEHPYYLLLLPLCFLPLLFFIFYKKWSRKQIGHLGSAANVRKQLVGFSLIEKKSDALRISLALVFCVLALANVRKGSGKELKEMKGLDIVVALDVSKSMLGTDVQPDRLSRSKSLVQMLLKNVQGDRIGLVLFAGNAYLQSPVTSDYNAIKMMLETASPSSVPRQGTALGEAIDVARQSFFSDLNKYKVVLLITDGEGHDAEAVPMATKAHKEGVVIHTVGVGSPEGALLKDPATGTIKKDAQGNEVISKLNEAVLEEISAASDGQYFFLNNPGRVAEELTRQINNLEKRNQASVVFSRYNSYYQWFLLAALLILFYQRFFSKRKNNTSDL